MPSLSGPSRAPSSGGKAKQLIVLLHGYGADGSDLLGLAPLLAQSFPDAAFAAPNAPAPCEMGGPGYQWFSLRNYSPLAMARGDLSFLNADEIEHGAAALNDWLDGQLIALGLKEKDLTLIGFSQGTMMSLHVSLRRKMPCAGVVGFSGAYLAHPGVSDPIRAKPPICLIHGTADEVVPFACLQHAAAALKQSGIYVETYSRPGLGHGIDPEGLEIAGSFLRERF